MWAKIITIKITKHLNYFSLCAFNLFYSQISQFELNYWNKWTFPRHSNLLRCTCICISWYFASLLKCNEFNLGCFQVYRFASVCIASCIVPIACSADRETVTEFYTETPPPQKTTWNGEDSHCFNIICVIWGYELWALQSLHVCSSQWVKEG